MFYTFFLRNYRFFTRNMIVSVLPLVMPIIFLSLFLDATGTAGNAPTLRLGVVQSEISSPLAQSLIDSDVVSVDPFKPGANPKLIDSRRFDAVLLASGPDGRINVIAREGFAPWVRAVFARLGNPSPARLNIVASESSGSGYLAFILPGLFVMVLIQLSVTSTAAVVLNDRADGTYRMIATVEGAMRPMILAELSFRLIFAIICYLLMTIIISVVAGSWLGDRLALFTMVFFIGATMMILLGFTVGGLLPGRRNWTSLITLLGLAFWFFSDILFQASQHPIARPVALLLPPTYLTDALRQISTQQPGTFALTTDIAVMLAFIVALSLISARYFNFETNDDRL